MEGITLDEYARQHPDVSICRVGGVYHAWKPAADGKAGEETHAETAGQLLEKLAG